jgi:hypothetical protein
MYEPNNQIVGILNSTLHQMPQNRALAGSLTDPQVDNKKPSHKYSIVNNLIVFEKYDRHGKLTSRIPWSPTPIDDKA